MEREQFQLGDIRPLDEVMRELLVDGYIPSFCTACYRLGRTGEHFMEFAIPGFIQNMCTPNALTRSWNTWSTTPRPKPCAAGEAGDPPRDRTDCPRASGSGNCRSPAADPRDSDRAGSVFLTAANAA